MQEWERDVRRKGRYGNGYTHGRSTSAETITPSAGEEGDAEGEELERVLNVGEAYGSWGMRHPYAYAGGCAEDEEDENMCVVSYSIFLPN